MEVLLSQEKNVLMRRMRSFSKKNFEGLVLKPLCPRFYLRFSYETPPFLQTRPPILNYVFFVIILLVFICRRWSSFWASFFFCFQPFCFPTLIAKILDRGYGKRGGGVREGEGEENLSKTLL